MSISSIVITVLVLGVVIIVHELGHFWAAKGCGILVEEFSIGMGPRIVRVKGKETLFSLRLFPIGGSCRMLGDETEEDGERNDRAFMSKPVWKRLIVLFAGITMNAILAFVIMAAFFTFNSYYDTSIEAVMPGYPAEAAGLVPGDRINRVNGRKMLQRYDIIESVEDAARANPSGVIELQIIRGGKKHYVHIQPMFDAELQRFMIGFQFAYIENPGFTDVVRTAGNTCISYVRTMFESIGKLFKREVAVDEVLMGPIGMVSVIGNTYEQSVNESPGVAFWNMMSFVVGLSVTLAIFNFLPIPGLDGGRIVFLLIEAVRRKPLPPEREGMIHFAGLVLLMIFAVFVAYNDILRLV